MKLRPPPTPIGQANYIKKKRRYRTVALSHHLRLWHGPIQVERTTQETHARLYNLSEKAMAAVAVKASTARLYVAMWRLPLLQS